MHDSSGRYKTIRTDWHKWHTIPSGWKGRQFEKFLKPEEMHPKAPAKVSQSFDGDMLPLGALTLGDKTVSDKAGLFSYASDDHLLTVAPSRAGKGTTQIIPTLLTYEGSTMVIDIKGENHAITADHRSNIKPGAKVFKFAPFENDTMFFNPLDFIHGQAGNPEAHNLAYDDCTFLAELMIPSAPHGHESFWVTDARNLLAVILLHVKTAPEFAEGGNMAAVCDIFANPEGLKASLQKIIETTQCLQVASLAAIFEGYEDKVLSSVQSTAISELRCWFSEPIQKATSRSNFNFLQLKRSMIDDDAPISIYVVFPPDRVRTSRNVLRTIIGISIYSQLRDKRRPKKPVLYLLDEFPSLGYMPAVLDGLSYLAGYGVQLWTFAQTIGQLQSIYGQAWQTFTASAGMFSAFNINDVETSEYLARLLGKTDEYQERYTTYEIAYEQVNRESLAKEFAHEYKHPVNSEGSPFNSRGEYYGPAVLVPDYAGADQFLEDGGYYHVEGNKYERQYDKERSNHRFTTDEVAPPNMVRQLGDRFSLVFIKGLKPALVRKVPYYQVPEFKGKFGRW